MSPISTLLTVSERLANRHAKRVCQGAMLAILVFLWAPIFVLIFMSFAKVSVLSFPPKQLTLDWYWVFLSNESAHDSIVTSLKVGVPASFAAVVLSIMIGFAADRYEFPGKEYLQTIAMLPLIVPLIVVGVALTLTFGTVGIDRGFTTVVIAHLIRTLPFAMLIVVPTILSFDRSLEEASKDLGANELQTFKNVTVPNILPGIIAGWLLAFTVSFNDFVYTYFVTDARTRTLPLYIWSRVRHDATPEVNVISVVFLVVAVLLTLIAVALTRVELVSGGYRHD